MIKNVKKIMGLLYGLAFCTAIAIGMPQMARAAEVAINEINFPDEVFRDYVSNEFDKDNNRKLSEVEIAEATTMYAFGAKNLKGVEYFTALTELDCSYSQLTSLDISKNMALTFLNCDGNQITSLDISKNTVLKYLHCSYNKLTTLDVNNNEVLTDLDCSNNQLTELNINKNITLESLNCSDNQLIALDTSKNTALTILDCSDNQLIALDASKNTALTILDCSYNQLTTLDINNSTTLISLSCSNNQLTNLDVSKNTKLTELSCFTNWLGNLDLSNNTELTDLDCSFSQLVELDIRNNTALTNLSCSINQMTSLDVSQNTALKYLSCYSNKLTSLDLSNNTELTNLNCSSNQLTALDTSKHTDLIELNCYDNQLKVLDVSNNIVLTNLYCDSNQLTNLDLSKNTELTRLRCISNKLTSLDLSNNIALTYLYLNCNYNNLTELKLNSQTYDKLSLYKGYLHGTDVNLSDLQNITETATNDYYTESLLKVTDITKPATYKVNGKDFTIIYTDTVVMPSESPSPEPSESPSASPSESPSAEPSVSPSISPSETPSPSPVVPSDVHIFSNYDYTTPVISDEPVIYGNGINKKIDGKMVNNKALTVYTDITASYKHTPNSNDTVKSSVGKVIVGVTKSDVKPEVNNKNKITDISASNIAKAKIKNGQITVTAAGKEGGLVYLWVIDTGNKGVSACCPIDVKLAPKKLEVQSTTGTKLTNTKLANGNTLEVCVAGLVGSIKTDDCTYTATVDSKYQSYITVTPVDGSTNKFTIKAIGLKNNKDTKAAVTFKCDQNGKKTNFSLTITK